MTFWIGFGAGIVATILVFAVAMVIWDELSQW